MNTWDLVWFRNWLCNVVNENSEIKVERYWEPEWDAYFEVHFVEASSDWYHFAVVLFNGFSAYGDRKKPTVLNLQVFKKEHQFALNALDDAIRRFPSMTREGKTKAIEGPRRIPTFQVGT